MDRIEIGKLSAAYDVRRLGLADAPVVYAFCKADTQYYARCGAEVTLALVEHDLTALPPGGSPEQHYYLGFFTRGTLTAVMDLIAGYPGGSDLSLGFFMTHSAIQGAGTGSRIASEALAALQAQGFRRCILGMDKDNPQSTHFWRKNGFRVVRELPQDGGTIQVAERLLDGTVPPPPVGDGQ